MIDLSESHLHKVREILKQRVPGCETRVFGSRVTGRSKPTSDLDLAVVGVTDPEALSRLREDFQESDLPFRVDVVDWAQLTPEFQAIISRKFEIL